MKWLQISDLHFGYDNYDAERLDKALLNYEKRRINGFHFSFWRLYVSQSGRRVC